MLSLGVSRACWGQEGAGRGGGVGGRGAVIQREDVDWGAEGLAVGVGVPGSSPEGEAVGAGVRGSPPDLSLIHI